jgi:hypothetical protein
VVVPLRMKVEMELQEGVNHYLQIHWNRFWMVVTEQDRVNF